MLSPDQIKEKIAQRQRELEELEQQLKEATTQKPEYRIATQLHGLLCTANHIDQCGWDYETDWKGCTRQRYLDKARALIRESDKLGVDADTALQIFTLVKRI